MNHLSSVHRVLLVALLLIVFQACLPAALVDFELLPAADLTAQRGSTVGWGYILTNNSAAEWLVPMALNSDPFLYGVPIPIFDFPVLPPGASVSVNFDVLQMLGLYAVTIAPDAPSPFIEQGTFTLSAQWWNDDPLGVGTPVGDAADSAVGWSVAITAVPEPGNMLPFCLVVPALYGIRRNVYRRLGGNE